MSATPDSGADTEDEKKPIIDLKVLAQYRRRLLLARSSDFQKSETLELPGSEAATEDEKKRMEQPINLKVKGQDGIEVFCRIKRSTPLKKLMGAYCDKQSVELNSIAFIFDGYRLRGDHTPDEMEMEEGDEIDAMLHQTGGYGVCS